MENNSKSILQITKNNIKVVFSIPNIFFIVAIFIYILLTQTDLIKNTGNFGEIIKNIFYGVDTLEGNMIKIFSWVLYQFFIIFIIGNFFFKELGVRSYYTVYRFRSKRHWHLCLQIASLLSCFIYFIFGTIIVFLYSVVSNNNTSLINIKDIIEVICLLCASSYYLVTVYIIYALISKKHALSFIAILITVLFSTQLGYIFKVDKYIPLNQGIIAKHVANNFNFAWSIIFLTIFIIIDVFIINNIIVKKDLCELTH
ncbi:hypothetical protein [Inconstantimicrobium mannanitabidum]|uniref:Uncharacterized protein n=1 Tax=Inconstantimicrobium mannanitabidum TaxID=1604901 RepID=A0ACB5RGF8_9CLOT|nr:hypothetical protein [Clostridium sp. TW13]GKX68176.1 hypothetical protein rsdtw13_34340 [Clostridium sp. TW13]